MSLRRKPGPHPAVEILALYFSEDLPWLDRWKVRRHLAGCEACDRQVALFRASAAELKRQARTETLTGFEAIADWPRLEREMQGNIAVGVAAARCIDTTKKSGGILIRLSLASGLVLLFVLGWVTHVPPEQSSRIYAALDAAVKGNRPFDVRGPILRSQPDGIVVGSPEGSLTILHPAGAVVSFSGTSAMEARYVDDETGQVTITNVYGQ